MPVRHRRWLKRPLLRRRSRTRPASSPGPPTTLAGDVVRRASWDTVGGTRDTVRWTGRNTVGGTRDTVRWSRRSILGGSRDTVRPMIRRNIIGRIRRRAVCNRGHRRAGGRHRLRRRHRQRCGRHRCRCRRRHRRGGVDGDAARCVARRAIDGAPFGKLPGLCVTGGSLFCVRTIARLPERRRWTGTGKLIGDHWLVDDANRIAIGAAGACRDDAGGRHDQGANTCCQERPAAAAGVDRRRRRGASEMSVSHAIVHGLVGQGSEASDEVVVVHNVYIVAGSQGDMGSVEVR